MHAHIHAHSVHSILPDIMHVAKMFKGKPRQLALCELVPNWYKTFPPDHFGQVEMNDSTMLSNQINTA